MKKSNTYHQKHLWLSFLLGLIVAGAVGFVVQNQNLFKAELTITDGVLFTDEEGEKSTFTESKIKMTGGEDNNSDTSSGESGITMSEGEIEFNSKDSEAVFKESDLEVTGGGSMESSYMDEQVLDRVYPNAESEIAVLRNEIAALKKVITDLKNKCQ